MAKKLLNLNGLAILATLVNHAHGWVLVAMVIWANRYLPVQVPNYDQVGSISYYVMRIVEQIVQFGIVAFLFVSGYFVAFATGRNQKTVNWKTVLARVKFLLIPYLLWAGFMLATDIVTDQSVSLLQAIWLILSGDIRGPYYFVPLLIQFYILSPLFVPLAKYRAKQFLIVTAVIQLLVMLMLYPNILGTRFVFTQVPFYILSWLFISRIFWFSSGLVVGFHITQFKKWAHKVRWLMLALALVFLILGFLEWEWLFQRTSFFVPLETLIDNLYAMSFVTAFMGFDQVHLPLEGLIGKLGGESYGIYLIHVPAQEFFARFVYHFMPYLLGMHLLNFTLILIIGLVVPLALIKIVKNSPIQPYYKYIVG